MGELHSLEHIIRQNELFVNIIFLYPFLSDLFLYLLYFPWNWPHYKMRSHFVNFPLHDTVPYLHP